MLHDAAEGPKTRPRTFPQLIGDTEPMAESRILSAVADVEADPTLDRQAMILAAKLGGLFAPDTEGASTIVPTLGEHFMHVDAFIACWHQRTMVLTEHREQLGAVPGAIALKAMYLTLKRRRNSLIQTAREKLNLDLLGGTIRLTQGSQEVLQRLGTTYYLITSMAYLALLRTIANSPVLQLSRPRSR